MEYDVVIEDDDFALFLKRCNRMTKAGWTAKGFNVAPYPVYEIDENGKRRRIVRTIYAQAFVKGNK